MSLATLRRVRGAETGISPDTAVTVTRVLGVSLDELTGLEPSGPAVEPPKAAGASEQGPRLLRMYGVRLAEQKEQFAATSALYVRAVASGKKRELVA